MRHTSETLQGQIYIPTVNWIREYLSCLCVDINSTSTRSLHRDGCPFAHILESHSPELRIRVRMLCVLSGPPS